MKRKTITIFTLLAMALGFAHAQVEYTTMPTNEKFIIQSALNYGRNSGGCWDIPGSPTSIDKGLNIQVWDLDNKPDNYYTLKKSSENGFYEIFVGNNFYTRVDVAKGDTKNGTNIGTWKRNGESNQRFLFHHLGDGRFKIYTRKGQVICLAGQKNENGTNVHIWADHNVIATEWYLIDAKSKKAFIPTESKTLSETKLKGDAVPEEYFQIQSALSYRRSIDGFWDLKGRGEETRNRGVNVQIWTIGNEDDQKFLFKKKQNSPYYQIHVGNSSNGVIDLAGGKTDNGTNVHIWEANNSGAQDFYLKHLGEGRFKIYHKDGKIINLKSSNSNNGNNVQLWNDHNAIHCEWYLINPISGKAYVPQ